MAQAELTTLSRVKSWLGVASSTEDTLIKRLVQDTSRFVLNYLERPTIFRSLYNDWHDGYGQMTQTLKHWPVLSITQVNSEGVMIPQAANIAANGYMLEAYDGLPPGKPQRIILRGYAFPRGLCNINIMYMAGYTIQDEARTIPVSSQYMITPDAPYGNFAVDHGVKNGSGTALTYVAGTPATGQYTLVDGVYSFHSSDAGASVLLTYSYIPADVEHAVMQLVAERYRYRSRIGESSKSIGGQESASFIQKDLPDYVRLLLQPYRRALLA